MPPCYAITTGEPQATPLGIFPMQCHAFFLEQNLGDIVGGRV